MSDSHAIELRLVKIHDDGEHLVLKSSDGTEFTLPIDQNLRTSVAKARRLQPARSRNGSGAFGPRDIQARFRQGATVEEIVEESGWDAERVRRYEWPIVAERAHIITAARSVLISSIDSGRNGEGKAANLDEHISRQAQKFGFDETSADWNTFQQESGSWTISVDFNLPDAVAHDLPRGVVFPARWNYNPANQGIYASNESAYFLMGRDDSTDGPLPGIGHHETHAEEPESAPAVQKPARPVGTLAPALTAEQMESVRRAEKSAEAIGQSGTRNVHSARERKLADLLERARRASLEKSDSTVASQTPAEPITPLPSPEVPQEMPPSRSAEVSQSEKESEPAKDSSTQQDSASNEEKAESTTTLVAGTDSTTELQQSSPRENQQEQEQPGENPPATSSEPNNSEHEQKASEEQQPAKVARPKRASVPSWDDIIFGNQRK